MKASIFMNEKSKFGIGLLTGIIISGYLLYKKDKYLTEIIPESFIGMDALQNLKKYLILFIAINIGAAIIVCGLLLFVFYISGIINHEKAGRCRSFSIILISILLFFLLFIPLLSSGSNHLDVQCSILGKSSNNLIKSIQLLNEINSDIKQGETKIIIVNPKNTDEEIYTYKSGRFSTDETEYLLKTDNEYKISQLSVTDYYKLSLSKAKNVSCEIYENSKIIKSITEEY